MTGHYRRNSGKVPDEEKPVTAEIRGGDRPSDYIPQAPDYDPADENYDEDEEYDDYDPDDERLR